MQAEHDEREAAEAKPQQQDFAGADMVDDIAERRLGQARDHREYGQREAQFDIADAELRFQEGKQHRQREDMEMAHPMGR